MLCSPQTPIYFEIMHGYAGLLYIKNGKNYWLMNLWTWEYCIKKKSRLDYWIYIFLIWKCNVLYFVVLFSSFNNFIWLLISNLSFIFTTSIWCIGLPNLF
jgi:hypothetical protein